MKDKSRHGSATAFLDLLFNFLLGFVLLFVILMAIIKVESAKPAVEDKNEFIITMTWNEGVDDDMDLWIMGPTGKVVGFPFKEGDGLFLQRDDLGRVNDMINNVNGEKVVVPLNQEIINIRKIIPGRYVVNAHFYRRRGNPADGPEKITLKLIKVNPFKEEATVTKDMDVVGAEETLLVFEVMPDGSVVISPTTPIPFAVRNNMAGTGPF